MSGKQTIDEIKFVDDISLKTGEKETTELPYRYIVGPDGERARPTSYVH